MDQLTLQGKANVGHAVCPRGIKAMLDHGGQNSAAHPCILTLAMVSYLGTETEAACAHP